MKGTLKNGFKYNVSDSINDDYEILELAEKAQQGDGAATVAIVKRVFGEEQTKKLKEHIRDENGVVSAKLMGEALVEVMGKAAKN